MVGFQIHYIDFDGKSTPVEDVDRLRTLYNLLGSFLDSEESKGHGGLNTNATSYIRADASIPVSAVRIPHVERRPNRPLPGEAARDYAIKAWMEIKRPADAREIAQKMLDLGWQTKAKGIHILLSTARGAMKEAGLIKTNNGSWLLPDDQSDASAKQSIPDAWNEVTRAMDEDPVLSIATHATDRPHGPQF